MMEQVFTKKIYKKDHVNQSKSWNNLISLQIGEIY